MTHVTSIGRRSTPVLLAFAVSLFALGRTGVAQDAYQHEGQLGKWINANVVGTNYCVGCALKKDFGAGAQCSVYGHQHALAVNQVVGPDGKELNEWKGTTLFYLENDPSTALINQHHGEKLSVHGKIYVVPRVLEVTSFEVVD